MGQVIELLVETPAVKKKKKKERKGKEKRCRLYRCNYFYY
jgi:hypothetical protein